MFIQWVQEQEVQGSLKLKEFGNHWCELVQNKYGLFIFAHVTVYSLNFLNCIVPHPPPETDSCKET
jgi:hypothetical protein